MMNHSKVMNSTKRALLVALASTVTVVGLATPAMAQGAKDRGGASTPSTAPQKDQGIKDQGIKSCDLKPTGCKSASESAVEPANNNAPEDQGKKSCEFSFAKCEGSTTTQSATDSQNCEFSFARCDVSTTTQSATDPEHNSVKDSAANTSGSDKDKPLKDQGTSGCDLKPSECKSGPAPKTTAAATTTASDVHGCPFDYTYDDEDFDTCLPGAEDFGAIPVFVGDKPWPASAGGYVGLLGDTVQDLATTVGVGVFQIGLGHYAQEGLVEYGEALFPPLSWGFEGLGYTAGFAGDAGGALVEGAGEVVGAIAEGAGDAVDAVGSAAGEAWDEVSSWF